MLSGIVIGCSTLTRLGDVVGRKPIYCLGMVLHVTFMSGLFLVKNEAIVFALLILFGLSMSSRYYVGYTYNMELQPKSHYVLVSTTMFLMESITYFFICIYFLKISNSWKKLQIPNLTFVLIGLITIPFFPESPRYLVSKGQFQKARKNFAWIGWFNGLDEQTIKDRLAEITFNKEYVEGKTIRD